MRVRLAVFVALIAALGCSPRRDSPAANDSLLSTPSAPDTHAHATALPNGLLIDSSRLGPVSAAHTLDRFSPKQVLAIYEAYRPLRRPNVTESQVDSFLRAEKINSNELHAVLVQGDRLGWSAPDSTRK
jgi:hypothetical protein